VGRAGLGRILGGCTKGEVPQPDYRPIRPNFFWPGWLIGYTVNVVAGTLTFGQLSVLVQTQTLISGAGPMMVTYTGPAIVCRWLQLLNVIGCTSAERYGNPFPDSVACFLLDVLSLVVVSTDETGCLEQLVSDQNNV